jgi:hypothetical protein
LKGPPPTISRRSRCVMESTLGRSAASTIGTSIVAATHRGRDGREFNYGVYLALSGYHSGTTALPADLLPTTSLTPLSGGAAPEVVLPMLPVEDLRRAYIPATNREANAGPARTDQRHGSRRLHSGRRPRRWLPDGDKDTIVVNTGDPNANLSIWLERRG